MKIGFEEGENYHISDDAKVKVTSYVYGKTKVTQKLKIIIQQSTEDKMVK